VAHSACESAHLQFIAVTRSRGTLEVAESSHTGQPTFLWWLARSSPQGWTTMLARKTIMAAAGGVLALSAVGAGGVLLAQGGTATTSAQTPATGAAVSPTPNARQAQAQADEDAFLTQLASNLKVDRTTLNNALKQTAKDEVAKAVQAGTLTQSEATQIDAQIDSGAFPHGFGIGFGGGDFGGGFGVGQLTGLQDAISQAFQTTVGETEQQFRSEVQAGKTPTEVFAAHNTTAQAVGQAESAAAKPVLDAAVQAQKITQTQETDFLQRLQNGPGFGPGGMGGPGGHGGPPPANGASGTPGTSGTSSATGATATPSATQ
jgi:hypothetical protein